MKSLRVFLLVNFCSVLLLGCNSGNQPFFSLFNNGKYIQFIESQINNETDTINFAPIIRNFYQERDFHPVWTEKGLQKKKVNALSSFLADSYKHGISLSFFNVDSIFLEINKLDNEKTSGDSLFNQLYKIERDLTDVYVKYCCAISYGAVDPKIVHGNKWYYETLKPDSAFVVECLKNIDNADAFLRKIQPADKNYLKLQSEITDLYKSSDSLRNDSIIGKIAANLERMRWKLKTPKSSDSVYICVNIPDFTYRVFQNDSLVIINKICCGKTQNPENNPARNKNGIILPFRAETPLIFSYITSITLNPEWNIPYDIIKNEYYPKLVKNNTACVNREKLYIKDSRTSQYVEPESIDWQKVNRGNIPYRLYQTSGNHNALGRVKFVFANSESVYLHDTNNKGAFSRKKRALSHGCVRVENPFELAEWIYEVNNFDTNYVEQLHIILGAEPVTEKGEEFLEKRTEKENEYYENLSEYDKRFYRSLRPSSVGLKKKIPLYIEYFTCFVDENGEIQYREDIYYKDGNILRTTMPELNF